MFLVAITKHEISSNFKSNYVEEFKINSFFVTIVTDNFLSKFISETNGFSVIESPIISSTNFKYIIFSEVNYAKNNNILSILKSTISGRPIYYHVNLKGDFFCSTHISMLRNAGVTIEQNNEALPEFFVYRCVLPPQSLYNNINQLIPGSRIHIKLTDQKCKIVKIEEYIPPIPVNKKEISSVDTILEQTVSFLNESIRALEPCKDRLSVLLSGGLDSSILFKICQTNYGIDTSYSTGYPFEEPEKNMEREYALSAADAFGTEHNYYETTSKRYLHGFLEGISAAEEPLNHLQTVMFYLLFKEGIPNNKDIVISGWGADGFFGTTLHNFLFRSEKYELLTKYPWYKLLKFASRISGRGQKLIDSLDRRNLPISDADNILWSIESYGSENWSSKYFSAKKHDIINSRYNAIKSFEDRSIYDVLAILEFYSASSVGQSIFSKLGESQGKILYYPYHNLNLLNYAFSLPWNVKLKNPKNILRGVARKLKIPEFIVKRPKSSFGIRPERWSEKGGVFDPMIPLASKVINEKHIRSMQLSEPKKAMTFWNMLNYSIWKRLCVDNEPIEVLLEELNETM